MNEWTDNQVVLYMLLYWLLGLYQQSDSSNQLYLSIYASSTQLLLLISLQTTLLRSTLKTTSYACQFNMLDQHTHVAVLVHQKLHLSVTQHTYSLCKTSSHKNQSLYKDIYLLTSAYSSTPLYTPFTHTQSNWYSITSTCIHYTFIYHPTRLQTTNLCNSVCYQMTCIYLYSKLVSSTLAIYISSTQLQLGLSY